MLMAEMYSNSEKPEQMQSPVYLARRQSYSRGRNLNKDGDDSI
jgi:hypothetical protein